MIAAAEDANRPKYDFSKPADLAALAGGDPVVQQLIATKAFERLKHIHFLGGIDYLLVRSPNGAMGNRRHNRYQHSLGVAHLASIYCERREVAPKLRRIICIAAMLHDIGHAPLSHSLEPVFTSLFGIEHHKATADIICGRVPLGQNVYGILCENSVDVERIAAIVLGQEELAEGFFSGPINFDTIEGILRSQTYARPRPNIPNPEAVVDAAIVRSTDVDREITDSFWGQKDQVYRHLINSPLGVLADFYCQQFMLDNRDRVRPEDYFVSEKEIFQKLFGLREFLTNRSFESLARRNLKNPIAYKERRFFIDTTGDFSQREDRVRYKQHKYDKVLLPSSAEEVERFELEQDLFDDERYPTSEAAF